MLQKIGHFLFIVAAIYALNGDDLTPQVAAQEAALTPIRRPAAQPLPNHLTAEERTNIRVYEKTNRSVVNINTRAVRRDNLNFFMVETPSEGAGSGSVIDRLGHILTNYHVVEDAQQIEVTLWTGNIYPAQIVGHDATNDIAVLKIDAPAKELEPVTLGDSAQLRVGQRVYVLGNPFELERTLTTGIISSLNRTLPSRRRRRVIKSIIQVDAAMNPGNSGGPLLDTGARLIGMNTAIAGTTGQNSGVGFAIPVNRIKRVVPELIEHGKITRPDVGITTVAQTEEGLLIRTLAPGGPADKAGLRGFRIVRGQVRQGGYIYETERVDPNAADLIVGADGKPVRTFDDFLSVVEDKKPGDPLELRIIREDREIQITVRLRASVD